MRIGIDLVEHKDIMYKDERFIKRVLSSQEFEIYSSFTNFSRRVEYLASRFACKEAIIKCFPEKESINFCEISILNKKNGAPYALIYNEEVELQISLSHTDNYSVAIAILPSSDDDLE
ncbi:MAG: 4'-phosphopantetheinyl transferase superfamily protein [Anaeroplasmataceae bacterium]|nr:4'-phosphopantetheinyl transferase superfamily protein [Anaeroplasmataceae bacterium]